MEVIGQLPASVALPLSCTGGFGGGGAHSQSGRCGEENILPVREWNPDFSAVQP
jgi:hypothetical protein